MWKKSWLVHIILIIAYSLKSACIVAGCISDHNDFNKRSNCLNERVKEHVSFKSWEKKKLLLALTWAFIQNINFSSSVVFTGFHLLQFLNVVICSLITLVFKCLKLHQILSQLSTINLAQVLEINIFGTYYSNLNNPFQIY